MYVKVIEKGCPICKSKVAGNNTSLYLCVDCNLAFKFKHLNSKKISKIITDNEKLNWTKKTLK